MPVLVLVLRLLVLTSSAQLGNRAVLGFSQYQRQDLIGGRYLRIPVVIPSSWLLLLSLPMHCRVDL